MRLRSLLTAGAAAVGLAVASNRLLSRRADPLEPALSGEQRTYRWRGMDVEYTEAGDPDDQDVVLVHGISAVSSSREWNQVFDDLAENFHVIAPDLPGFGRSARPALVYSASLYESFVEDFIRDVSVEPVCIASSLSAAYVVSAASRLDLSQLVLLCPTAETRSSPQPIVRTVLRTPFVGTTLFNVLASKPSIRRFNADHAYFDSSAISDEDVAYQWQTAHQPGARFAPASFVSGYLDAEVDLDTELAELDVPTTLVWGREADITPLYEGRSLAQTANAKLVVLDRSRLLPHVEHPDTFVDVVSEELLAQEPE